MRKGIQENELTFHLNKLNFDTMHFEWFFVCFVLDVNGWSEIDSEKWENEQIEMCSVINGLFI